MNRLMFIPLSILCVHVAQIAHAASLQSLTTHMWPTPSRGTRSSGTSARPAPMRLGTFPAPSTSAMLRAYCATTIPRISSRQTASRKSSARQVSIRSARSSSMAAAAPGCRISVITRYGISAATTCAFITKASRDGRRPAVPPAVKRRPPQPYPSNSNRSERCSNDKGRGGAAPRPERADHRRAHAPGIRGRRHPRHSRGPCPGSGQHSL